MYQIRVKTGILQSARCALLLRATTQGTCLTRLKKSGSQVTPHSPLFPALSRTIFCFAYLPQHCLYFLPLPHGHGSLRANLLCPLRRYPDLLCFQIQLISLLFASKILSHCRKLIQPVSFCIYHVLVQLLVVEFQGLLLYPRSISSIGFGFFKTLVDAIQESGHLHDA